MTKEPTLEELRAKVYELENYIDSGLDSISERSDELIKNSGVPMTVWERQEKYPTKAVYDIEGHPFEKLSTFDEISIFAMVMLPTIIFMIILLCISIADF